MARDPNDRVTISYRIPERLRRRIEEAAEADGLNITQEMTKCIEYGLNEEERIAINSPLIRMLSLAMRQVEDKNKLLVSQDNVTAETFRDLASGILRVMIPYRNTQKGTLDSMLEMFERDIEAANIALEVLHDSDGTWSKELVERLYGLKDMAKGIQSYRDPKGEPSE